MITDGVEWYVLANSLLGALPDWSIDWVRLNVPPKHITGHIGDGFYGLYDPTNSVKAPKEGPED